MELNELSLGELKEGVESFFDFFYYLFFFCRFLSEVIKFFFFICGGLRLIEIGVCIG